jgi:c-di-GMP-binding flagellar brake protein YcgR
VALSGSCEDMKKLKVNSQPPTTSKLGILAIERRKHPRFVVELPLDYCRVDGSEIYGGIVANASEGGLLVYLPERLDVGQVLQIQIFYVKDLEFNMIKGLAKVVWSDLAARESWGEYRYGVQFLSIGEQEFGKLIHLLKEVGK